MDVFIVLLRKITNIGYYLSFKYLGKFLHTFCMLKLELNRDIKA